MNMKNRMLLLVPILMFGFANVANAAILYSQPITLSPGWNIVSTPKILESHIFSVTETSDNFDIYALDPSKTSGWATLADLGQTEFTPLHGYFINNKTGINQTLTFNYKADATPNQRLFERVFPTTGWYSFGIANPSYALTTDAPKDNRTPAPKGGDETFVSNTSSILSSLTIGNITSYDTVLDFTNALYPTNLNSVALTDPWKAATKSDIYSLNNFRETKGYAIYIKSPGGLYSGFQNNTVPECSDGIDNDGDSLIDLNDYGCIDSADNHELTGSILSITNSTTGLVSTVTAGDSQVAILGFRADVEDHMPDVNIKSVRLNLGTSSAFYNKFFSKLYLTDSSENILASTTLDSSTVVKEGSNYFVTISGFDYTVHEGDDNSKLLFIKADVRSSISDTDITTYSPLTITLADNGVLGIDSAGINQYNPTIGSDVSHSIAIDSVILPAKLSLSLNSATPRKNEVIASQGSSENELDKLTLMVFDLKAEEDDVTINDLNIEVAKSGSGTATAPTVYLFEGSTELDSASISGNMASFADIDYVIPRDTTKTLTVKIDIRNANGTIANFITSASSTGITAENSLGSSVTDKNGSATGNIIGIRNIGPEFTLVSKSITTSGVPQANGINDLSTSTLTATFNVKVKAVGGDIVFGTNQATSSPFVASTTSFMIYRGDSPDSSISSYATSTSITFPSTCVTSGLTNSCRLAEGSEVTVPVSFQIQGRSGTGALTSGLYSIGIAQLNWQNVIIGAQTSTFMSGEVDWRTADTSFP